MHRERGAGGRGSHGERLALEEHVAVPGPVPKVGGLVLLGRALVVEHLHRHDVLRAGGGRVGIDGDIRILN